MSLKNILKKITASIIVMYMVFGNFVIAGIGLGKVIAEDTNMPKILIENKLEKYVSYSNELGKGAVIQSKLAIREESSKENHKEIAKTDIQIEVPKIDGILPERVSIISANTKLTNGKENGEISQNYNKESGLLNISCENEDGYNEYQEQAKDEFEIIYIYKQEAYREDVVKTAIKVTTTREYKLEYGTATGKSEKREEIILSKDIGGEIASYELTDASEIYKGYLYANEQNKTNYETNYKTTANLSVLNSELMDEIKIDLAKSTYITTKNNEQKNVDTNTIIYKSTRIEKEDFNKLLGQGGYIDFYIGNTKYATIRYLEPDKKGNRAYATYYHIEGIENPEAGKVEYPAGTTNVTMVTSKPQTEGKLNIENEKAIQASKNYGKAVKDINGIKETNKIEATKKYTVEEDKKDENGQIILDENGNAQKEQIEKIAKINEKENVRTIELKEPQTQMSLGLSNYNLSTLTPNKITATIKLNDTNSSCKLFTAGKIELTLPANLTSAKIINAQSLYTNGIKITNPKIENGKVILTVEGKQTTYDIENISGGVNIILDLELDINDLVATHTETLNLTYGQTKACTNVIIQSKPGLLVKNVVQTNQGKEVVLIDNSEKDIQVANGVQSGQANQTINLVNNYDKDLNNVEVIGLLGYKNRETVSDFDLNLIEAVNVSGVNAKVYYSKTATNQEWTENFMQDAKAYKVVIGNLKAKSNATINMKVSIPDNLDYNQKTYLTANVGYTYENNRLAQNSFVKLATEAKDMTKVKRNLQKQIIDVDKLEINSYAKIGNEILNENSKIYENEIINYIISVKNNSQTEMNGIKVKGTIPQGTKLIKLKQNAYIEDEWFTISDDSTIEKEVSIKPGETYILEYEVIINNNTKEINQESLVCTNSGEEIAKKQIKNIAEKAEISVKAKWALPDKDEDESEYKIQAGDTVELNLELKNLTDKEIKGNLETIFPKYNIEDLKYYIYDGEDEEKELSNKDIENISLPANETLYIAVQLTIKNFDNINTEVENFDVITKFTTKSFFGNEKEYYSNILSKKIYQSQTNLKVSMEAKVNNQKLESEATINNHQNIVYIVQIENIGKITDSYNIVDELSEGVYAKLIKYNTFDEEGKEQNNEEKLEQEENISLTTSIPAGRKVILTIECEIDTDKDYIENKVTVDNDIDRYESNTLKYYILGNDDDFKIDDVSGEEEDDASLIEDNKTDPTNPTDPTDPPNDNEGDNNKQKYKISGVVWLDSDKNGQRDTNEKVLSKTNVMLLDATLGENIKDENGNNKTAITDDNGNYQFDNLEKGNYLVIFEFDTSKYTVTNYRKENVSDLINSDAISSNVNINGTNKTVGITDKLEITNQNLENIDMGLIENANFDLSLEKQISSITVTNSQGNKTTNYQNKNFAKVDLVAKYMNNTNVIVTYKFVIKNKGDVTGYVDELVDNLPSGLEFSSELNKDWYKGTDGKLYTTSLSGIGVEPGKTSEIELVLTKKTTENTTGTFTNNAELTKISNIEAIEEKTQGKENNKSEAKIVISIKTGSAIMYIGITLGCLAIIVIGAYNIKKKILKIEI